MVAREVWGWTSSRSFTLRSYRHAYGSEKPCGIQGKASSNSGVNAPKKSRWRRLSWSRSRRLQTEGLGAISRWCTEPAKRGDWNHRMHVTSPSAPEVARDILTPSRAPSGAYRFASGHRWFRSCVASPPAHGLHASSLKDVAFSPSARSPSHRDTAASPAHWRLRCSGSSGRGSPR